MAPLIPKRWTGGADGESWAVEIEHDRFSETEPFVVSLHATHTDDTGTEETLVCASPEAGARDGRCPARLCALLPRWPIPAETQQA